MKNASTIVDANLEAGRTDAPAIITNDNELLTFGDLHRAVCRVAAELQALGVRREERVLLILDDTPAFPAAFLGAIRIGAVPVPVNFMYKASDYVHFLADSYARLAVVDDAFAEKISGAVAEYGGEVDLVAPADLLADPGHETFDPVTTHEDDMAFW
ncbi:MAG: AMP-binding protein, partial [bacterium]